MLQGREGRCQDVEDQGRVKFFLLLVIINSFIFSEGGCVLKGKSYDFGQKWVDKEPLKVRYFGYDGIVEAPHGSPEYF